MNLIIMYTYPTPSTYLISQACSLVGGSGLSPAKLCLLRPTSTRCTLRHLLERIPQLIILPHPMLPPLLRSLVLHDHLLPLLRKKAAYEPWVPQLASDAQVLAAAHQRVGFAAFSCRGDAVGVEVLLFAACY